MVAKISVIIADDHPVLRHGLRQIIERDFEVLVECGDGESALYETISYPAAGGGSFRY